MSYVRTVVDGNACYCVPIEHFEKLSNQVSIYYNALIAEQKNVEMLAGDLARANGLASERNKPERDVAPERKEGPDCRLCKNHELHRETSPRHQCLLLSRTALVCINGDAFVPAAEPVRLYAGGET